MGDICDDYQMEPGDEVIFTRYESKEGAKTSRQIIECGRVFLNPGKRENGIIKDFEIVNIQKLPRFNKESHFSSEYSFLGEKHQIEIEFSETRRKRTDSPALTDFYSVKYDGKLLESKNNPIYFLSIRNNAVILKSLQKYEFSILLNEGNDEKKNCSTPNCLQQIFYGAPGTGKSHKIKETTDAIEKEGRVFRTTFHPDSDYSTFVGCYKPSMKSSDKIYSAEELAVKLKEIKNSGVTYPCHKFAAQYWRSLKDLSTDVIKQILNACGFTESMNVEISKGVAIGQEYLNKEEDGKIIYTFTPQAFTNAYIKAWKTTEDVYLIIEEINRGNCAQIFGDLFQLLDRKNGVSQYPIDADTDLGNYIAKELENSTRTDFREGVKEGKKLMLPSNLYIWATMNTSDQSLFPIDSAFKRRWDWKYVKIAEGKDKITEKPFDWKILVSDTEDDCVRVYDWWKFLQLINKKIFTATQSADKQMGYFFAKANEKFNGEKNGRIIKGGQYESLSSSESLNIDYISAETFVNKVLFYLWTDVLKDNEYDEIAGLMKDGDEVLSFPDFFDESGEEISPAAVRVFLDNVMKDEDTLCDVAEWRIDGLESEDDKYSIFPSSPSFKLKSVIIKITEAIQDPKALYERAKGWWRMAAERAKKDNTEYVYVYSTPSKKITACYKVDEWKSEIREGKEKYGFDGKPIDDDPMIGQPVESIAHVRGQVVFYPK